MVALLRKCEITHSDRSSSGLLESAKGGTSLFLPTFRLSGSRQGWSRRWSAEHRDQKPCKLSTNQSPNALTSRDATITYQPLGRPIYPPIYPPWRMSSTGLMLGQSGKKRKGGLTKLKDQHAEQEPVQEATEKL